MDLVIKGKGSVSPCNLKIYQNRLPKVNITLGKDRAMDLLAPLWVLTQSNLSSRIEAFNFLSWGHQLEKAVTS